MEFIESERGYNQKLKIKLKTICGEQLSRGLLPCSPRKLNLIGKSLNSI
jgi:hypothetical protein